MQRSLLTINFLQELSGISDCSINVCQVLLVIFARKILLLCRYQELF